MLVNFAKKGRKVIEHFLKCHCQDSEDANQGFSKSLLFLLPYNSDHLTTSLGTQTVHVILGYNNTVYCQGYDIIGLVQIRQSMQNLH